VFWRRRKQWQNVISFLRRARLEEIETWIYQCLKGDTVRFSEISISQPHFWIVKAYREIEEGPRRDIEFATINLLKKIAADPTAWTAEFLGELFLLSDPVFLNSNRQGEIIDAALTILRVTASDPLGWKIACPAAQALLTLDYRAYPRLWMDIFDQHGAIVSPLVIEGLGRGSLKSLQTWLASKLPHPEIERGLINLLPFFVEREGASAIAAFLAPLDRLLSAEAREELDGDAEVGGFRIPWQQESLNARLISRLAGLLERALTIKHEGLWEHENDRDAFNVALSGLGQLLEHATEPSADSGCYLLIAQHYTKLLTYGLGIPALSNKTYQEIAQYAPLPELYEVTEFAIASGGLNAEAARSTLRFIYTDEKADKVVNEAAHTAQRSGKLSSNLSRLVREKLQLYRTLDKDQRELAENLVAQDLYLPQAEVWIREMAGELK
jgi:hypothetical protein